MKDQVDLDILQALQEDGRISNAEISRRLNLAPSAVLERMRRLERSGVIERFEVRLSPRKLGDRKSTRLNSSHPTTSRMPSSA